MTTELKFLLNYSFNFLAILVYLILFSFFFTWLHLSLSDFLIFSPSCLHFLSSSTILVESNPFHSFLFSIPSHTGYGSLLPQLGFRAWTEVIYFSTQTSLSVWPSLSLFLIFFLSFFSWSLSFSLLLSHNPPPLSTLPYSPTHNTYTV